ncbi:hypothetical protein [Streptomyces spectabilis]|uniref:Uncharacterized protein n=1 Tax=Streptomyces spectabilis TaxID=68270 RepID=A0A5P2XKI9_STRST|nr:hypothetical protein [Streptomyces spectabilis]MBB5102415.1 hypothetical protein [Streptomyces spectabilis]MCI3907457.1 hypothetical protein [Streptomyces spectabilis]QEV64164.1 hypothetical protein CP982_40290 [Streptomyces spectabilis]GGV31968.1 hypothetical protein GCM10010245_51900 [Streptomyces spectabilis]
MITAFTLTGEVHDAEIAFGISAGRAAGAYGVRTDQLLLVKVRMAMITPVPPEEPHPFMDLLGSMAAEETDPSRREFLDVFPEGFGADGEVAGTWPARAGGDLADDVDGQAALDRLLDRLADTPTPAGPTPRELDLPTTARLLPIVDVRQGGAGSAPR